MHPHIIAACRNGHGKTPELIEIMGYVRHEGAKTDRCSDPDEKPWINMK